MLASARVHAESDQHRVSRDLFLKDEGIDMEMRSSLSKDADPNQAVIIEGLKKKSEKERVSHLKKIEVAHFVTSLSQSVSKLVS